MSTKEDFANQFWNEYETYLKKYNKILKDLQILGFFKKINLIQPVPFSDQEFDSGFSKEEEAKLREIANSSDVLLTKVKLLLSPPKKDEENKNQIRSNKIFLVHGQNKQMKNDVIQTLQTLDLEPILLHEKLNKSSDSVKRIAEYPQVSFAIVLLSPDDIVYSTKEFLAEPKYKPNQNLVFELGYLLGKLGKQNVMVIYQKNKILDLSNYCNEIIWVEYKSGWDLTLIRELKTRNFDFDTSNLSWL
jgi:predicted nucleotide-binding protein